MKTDLADAAILVTGASGGIGSATARLLAAEGARVGVHYRGNAAAAEALAAELGEGTVPLYADLTREGEVDALFRHAADAFGGLDGVVVNAGVWPKEDVPLAEMELSRWQETIEADLTSAFLTCRGFLRLLAAEPEGERRQTPSIVLVGSTAALYGEAGHADYSAAKAAMTYGLTRTLKNEIVRLAPGGRVNCVCPGWVATPMSAEALKDTALVDRVTSTMALRKVATPEDIAAAIAFLLSPRLAGHISGEIVPVSGGMEGRLLHPLGVDGSGE